VGVGFVVVVVGVVVWPPTPHPQTPNPQSPFYI